MHIVQFKHRQEVSAKHTCSAAAARASAVSVLRVRIEYHCSAVAVLSRDINALFHKDIEEELTAHEP